MASYTIVFKKPKKKGDPVCNHHGDHVTDLNDYKYIRNVFQSNLMTNGGKYISLRDFNEDYDKEEIFAGSREGKKKVSFSDNIRFTPHCLRGEVTEERLDKDTTVYFIDSETLLQTAIDAAADGDVISLLEDQIVPVPLTCEDKVVVIDMCGSNILCKFDGEVEVSDNLSVKNTIPSSGEIKKYEEPETPTEPEEPVDPDPVPEDKNTVTMVAGESSADALAKVNESGKIVLPSDTTITENFTIDKEVSIVGDGTTVLTGTIRVAADHGKVSIEGVKFLDTQSSTGTGSGKRNSSGHMIYLTSNADLEIKNCTISNIKYFYSVIGSAGETGSITLDHLIISTNECYHILEAMGKTPNAVVKNCTVAADACTHNVFNFYDFVEGAKIELLNNEFGYSGNAYRFSNISNAAITVDITDNIMHATDMADNTEGYEANKATSPWWSGIMILQKYTETMDFSKMVFNITNLKLGDTVLTGVDPKTAEEQAWYSIVDNAEWGISVPTVNIA